MLLKHSNKREYQNAAVQDKNLENAKNILTPIYFSLVPTDFDQPWFHKYATRTLIEEKLKFCDLGTFALRPSTSYGGCYALSWVKEIGTIEHQVVYNQFPGYSFSQRAVLERELVFQSLTELVEQTQYLKTYLPNVLLDPVLIQKSIDQTSTDIVNSITKKLIGNEQTFTHLDWMINLVEFCHTSQDDDLSLKLARCEARTCIRFSNEEYVAPTIFKLDASNAQLIADAISKNNTLKALKITGYPGYMRRNFTPNITDTELEILLSALENNTNITSIDLSHNQITNHGAKLLADLILHNPYLKRINLDHNFITQEGLISIAKSLQQIKTLERLSLFNQLQKQLNNCIVLSSSPYDRFLLRLIDDSLKRRSELITSPLASFRGFVSPKEAEDIILSMILPNQSPQERPYIFYLNPNAPNRIYLCYLSNAVSNGSGNNTTQKIGLSYCHHQPIYRTLYGYSFNRLPLENPSLEDKGKDGQWNNNNNHNKTVTVPSLLEHCLWLIYGKMLLKEGDNVPPELREKIDEIKNMFYLWRLADIPCPKRFMENGINRQVGASTLSQLITRNKNIFSN